MLVGKLLCQALAWVVGVKPRVVRTAPAQKVIYVILPALLGLQPGACGMPLRLQSTVQQAPKPRNCRPLASRRPHVSAGVRRRPLRSPRGLGASSNVS